MLFASAITSKYIGSTTYRLSEKAAAERAAGQTASFHVYAGVTDGEVSLSSAVSCHSENNL
jgi:hypothetical protein